MADALTLAKSIEKIGAFSNNAEYASLKDKRVLFLGEWSEGTRREALAAAVRSAGFATVELDARGFRSGALNVLAGVPGVS